MKKEKEISNNELGRMISVGFAGVDKRFDSLHREMNERFDKVEKVILTEYRHRLEQVEKDLKVLKSALAM